jgi:hypothetical protein
MDGFLPRKFFCLLVFLLITFSNSLDINQKEYSPSTVLAQTLRPDTNLSIEQLSQKKQTTKTGIPKLETPLSELYLNRNQPSKLSPQTLNQVEKFLVDDSVQVVIVLKDIAGLSTIKEYFESIGADIVAEFETRVEIIVPISNLQELSEKEEVLYIRRPIPVFPIDSNSQSPALEPLASTGTYVTQGVVASKANLWHDNNYTGSGINIGILDSFQDFDVAQSLGELPPTMYWYGALGLGSRHGTAVAEVIHDMAPRATLTLSTPSSATQMASFIIGLAQSGHKIVSSSMGYYLDEPGDGIGTVSSAINTATNNYGTLYCQAAGNQARYHWDGYFSDSDGDGYHEFASGVEINLLNAGNIVPADYPVNLYLRWNDWPVSNQDYDLFLYYWNGASWVIVESSENWQDGTVPPTESINITTPYNGYYGFVIYKYNATGGQVLDIMGHNAPSFSNNQPNRSLIDAATADKSFSVAAEDVTTFNRESYSSIGPTHGTGGALLGGIAKPRISAFANVDTWSYGPGIFNGTSSATPHVAGAAALVRQAYPSYSPTQVMQFLENLAIDQGSAGYDYLYGAGRLNLGVPPPPKFPWNMFLPAIMSGKSTSKTVPSVAYWGAGNDVCCSTSSATFSLTSEGVTKSSTLLTCTAEASWGGWVSTTPGAKVFAWRFISSNCGSYQGSIPYTLAQGLYHLFVLGWNGSAFTMTVYTGTSTNSVNSFFETKSFVKNDNGSDTLKLVDEIILDIPAHSGEFPKGIMKATN